MDERILILTVGLPRSGKTTWAVKQGHPIVNPDSVRLAMHGQRFAAQAEGYVWAVVETMVKALFMAGADTVILDATNTTQARRAKWIDGPWRCEFKVFGTSRAICIARAEADCMPDLIPVIERMAEQYEPVNPAEGETI